MKYIGKCAMILAMGLFLLPLGRAQDTDDIANSVQVEAAKKRFLTEKLALSREEADDFWPLYDEYQRKLRELNEDFQGPKNPMLISDEEAERYLSNMFAFEEGRIALKKEYYQRFGEILSVRQVLYLNHLENQFRRELIKRIQERIQRQRENGPVKQRPGRKQ